jgi:hypothetical protein
MHSANILSIDKPLGTPREVNTLIRSIADTIHKLNEQIETAVQAGVTVELVRASRFHNGSGQWGDQTVPVIRMPETEDRWE